MTPGLAVEQAQAILDAANRQPACTRWEGCSKGHGHDGACMRRVARMPAAPALQPRHAPTNLGRCRTCPNRLTSADAWNRCNDCLKGGL